MSRRTWRLLFHLGGLSRGSRSILCRHRHLSRRSWSCDLLAFFVLLVLVARDLPDIEAEKASADGAERGEY